MGESEGGGRQNEYLLGPPSLSSYCAKGRRNFVGLSLFNYGLLSTSPCWRGLRWGVI